MSLPAHLANARLVVWCPKHGYYEPSADEAAILDRRTAPQGFCCVRCNDEVDVYSYGRRISPGQVP